MTKNKIFITGATGFVGKNLLLRLVDDGYDVTALTRNPEKIELVKNIYFDIDDVKSWKFEIPDNCTLIHCAWQNVRDIQSSKHIDEYYQKHYSFIESMVTSGIENLLITGSCYEYGLQYGPVSAETPTKPNTPYAIAKDALHKSLRRLQIERSFGLIWARLFYLYGEFQDSRCIVPQFDKALNDGEEEFNMSFGEQLLDYLPINEAVNQLIELLDKKNGIYNVCSGIPISLRRFLEQRMHEKNKFIKLNLGFYKYREQDSMAIWGQA